MGVPLQVYNLNLLSLVIICFLIYFKLGQIYNSILCNTMVLSSTIIIVPQMIEYGQEMPQPQTAGQPGMELWVGDTK